VASPTHRLIAGTGDFGKDQPYTCSVWAKLPSKINFGAVVARMTEADNYRGWDLWLEGGRVGSHIISSWPSD